MRPLDLYIPGKIHFVADEDCPSGTWYPPFAGWDDLRKADLKRIGGLPDSEQEAAVALHKQTFRVD